MGAQNLGSILAAAEGSLLTFGLPSEAALRDTSVTGIELYQPGTATSYKDRLVLVSAPIRGDEDLRTLAAECAGAAALILRPETPQHLTATTAPLMLRRSPWVTSDVLIRVLMLLTTDPETERRLAYERFGESERDSAIAIHRRESALLVLLNGTTDTALPATIIGLRPDHSYVVIAADATTEHLEQLRLALDMGFPGGGSVVTEGILLAVLPIDSGEDASAVIARMRPRLVRVMPGKGDLPIGVGHPVPGVLRLSESAAEAREVLRSLRFKLGRPPMAEGGPGPRIAEAADVDDQLILIRSADALRPLSGELAAPLRTLAEYDRDHGSDLLPTLVVALEYRGNVAEAARQLGIHANSLRARLDRIRDIAGIDSADPVSALRAAIAFLASPRAHNAARRGASFF